MRAVPKELQPIDKQEAREDGATRRFLLKLVDELFNEQVLKSPAFSMRGMSTYMHGSPNWARRLLTALSIDPDTKKASLTRDEMADILADQLTVTGFNLLRRYAKGLEKANHKLAVQARKEERKRARDEQKKTEEVQKVRAKMIKAAKNSDTANDKKPLPAEERLRIQENSEPSSAPIITTKKLDDWLDQATDAGQISAPLFSKAARNDKDFENLMASVTRSIVIAKNSLAQNGQNIGRIVPLEQVLQEDSVKKYDDFLYGSSRNGSRLYYLRILAMLLLEKGN